MATASAAAPPRPQSPGPFWPPSNLQQSWPQVPPQSPGRAPRRLSAPRRDPGLPGAWPGRRARSCPREQLARALRVPLFQGSPAARARPALPGHPAQTPARLTHPARGYPSAPGHARSRRRQFLPRGNSRPYFSRGGRTSPSPPPPGSRGREAWPRGQGAPAATVTDFARRSVNAQEDLATPARRKQIALAPRLVMASTDLCKELIWNVPLLGEGKH